MGSSVEFFFLLEVLTELGFMYFVIPGMDLSVCNIYI
jgi:hypothetical protein